MFPAALLGIVPVVLAHRGQVFAAGMLAAFGIFLNTFGHEPAKYTQSFTFEQNWLSSGVGSIDVVLGLFGISQALILLEENHAPETTRVEYNIFSGLRELKAIKRVATIPSSNGVIMSMPPGTGEFTSQLKSYDYAQKTSKEPNKFGDVSPEGLVAAKAANNAVPGAAMIPLLALGIPGEVLTAMMFSMLYVHNVISGPQLFQNQMDFVMAIHMSLLLLNVIVLVFLLFSTIILLKIIQIPTRFIRIMVLTFAFVGVYSLRNSITDCAIVAGFGVLGLILKRSDLPIAPIILGMGLGGMMEVKLRSLMAQVKEPIDIIDRLFAATTFGVIILILILHVWTLCYTFLNKLHKDLNTEPMDADHPNQQGQSPPNNQLQRLECNRLNIALCEVQA